MATLSFQKLWDSYPVEVELCDPVRFPNQCAILMGVALERAGVKMGSYDGMRCYPTLHLEYPTRHIIRAEELAKWLRKEKQVKIVGKPKIYTKKVSSHDFAARRGIVFILHGEGWAGKNHIDVWDDLGHTYTPMKHGGDWYFGLGEEVWFWDLV